MKKIKLLSAAIAASLLGLSSHTALAYNEQEVSLNPIGTYETGVFDEGAAEIVAFDASTSVLFVINADEMTVDMLNISQPEAPYLLNSIDVSDVLEESGGINSVAVHNGIVAVAVEHDDKQENGWIAFYDTLGNYLNSVEAGALPDMVSFSPNGRYVLSANEGEPSDDYQNDPEGTITVVDLKFGVFNPQVKTAGFTAFNHWVPEGVRITGPGATVAQDLEPEYITISDDSRTAWVTLQENNAIAVLNLRFGVVTALLPLGSKDHMLPGNGLDASNKDDAINITNWPVNGLYMPDSLASFKSSGRTYLITANEGDAREYEFETDEEGCPTGPQYEFDDGDCIYIDEARVKDIDLDEEAFADWDIDELQDSENLGRLKIMTTEGDTDGDGDFDKLYSYGGRSFSIWNAWGGLVFDSGDMLEQITAEADPDNFNSTNDENDSFDNRSDDKGPEPEGVTVGKIRGVNYAFIGLERVGGIATFDISNPHAPKFVDYINNRDFSVDDVEDGMAGDLGPEGLVFIPRHQSPNGKDLLVVGNEVSGSTTIYEITVEGGSNYPFPHWPWWKPGHGGGFGWSHGGGFGYWWPFRGFGFFNWF